MIWRPKVGQKVEIRYAREWRAVNYMHGYVGRITKVAHGPGPIVVEVDRRIIVPNGNVSAVVEKD